MLLLPNQPFPLRGTFAALREPQTISSRGRPVSIFIGLCEAAAVEAGLDERSLALGETLFGLRAAKDGAILSGLRLLTLALL